MFTVFILIATTFSLFLIAFIISILFRHRQKQEIFRRDLELQQAEAERRMLKIRLEIQEQTFRHIAREIHDNIGLGLTLAKLNLNTLSPENPLHDHEKVQAALALVSQAIDDLRDISRSLNADVIAEQGLIKALEKEVRKLKKLDLYSVNYTISGEPVFLDPQEELIILRIAQEALNNVIRHAHARTIDVSLAYGEQALLMQVTDDGNGFRPGQEQENSSSGLLNMRNRAELLNGCCTILEAPSGGTTVQLIIPY